MNAISSIGVVYSFAMIFPGIMAFILTGYLFSEGKLFTLSVVEMILAMIALGFLANTFGHSLGLAYRAVYKKSRDIPFGVFLRSYTVSTEKSGIYRRDIDYWFSIFCFYFNSATIILLLIVGKVITSIGLGMFVFIEAELAIAITSFIVAILLYMLAHWTMTGLVKLYEGMGGTSK